MNEFEIRKYPFNRTTIESLTDHHEVDWPVVYQISKSNNLYIGETTSLQNRMRQHIENDQKEILRGGVFRAIIDEKFNKSAALDLESFLIRYFSGDGKYKLLNRNDGMRDHDYYGKKNNQKKFAQIWDKLRSEQMATKTIAEIENSELFKFSPYKELNSGQLTVATKILVNIDEAIRNNRKSLSIIGGDAGTGKTIVIMYLAKLIADLQSFDGNKEDIDDESNFRTFFTNKTINGRFKNKRIALVIPQTSLRGRVESILDKSGLGDADFHIFSPIAFGRQEGRFDITLVDEAHLLKIGGYNSQGKTLQIIKDINKMLFGDDEPHSELDWIMEKSDNVVMVFSEAQRVRPGNITLKDDIQKYMIPFGGIEYKLTDQMRSRGGKSYIDYINWIFSRSLHPCQKEYFDKFEIKLFKDFRKFKKAIQEKENDKDVGLSRMIAGYAWEWKSHKKDHRDDYDIEIDGERLRWNSTLNNYLGSEKSKDEVGSIYTVQGDDLNYAGVIIGNDLLWRKGRFVFNKKAYADTGAKNRNKRQIRDGVDLTDDDYLEQVLRVYRVLLSRAIRGTYIYVCDEKLRDYLSKWFDVVE